MRFCQERNTLAVTVRFPWDRAGSTGTGGNVERDVFTSVRGHSLARDESTGEGRFCEAVEVGLKEKRGPVALHSCAKCLDTAYHNRRGGDQRTRRRIKSVVCATLVATVDKEIAVRQHSEPIRI